MLFFQWMGSFLCGVKTQKVNLASLMKKQSAVLTKWILESRFLMSPAAITTQHSLHVSKTLSVVDLDEKLIFLHVMTIGQFLVWALLCSMGHFSYQTCDFYFFLCRVGCFKAVLNIKPKFITFQLTDHSMRWLH